MAVGFQLLVIVPMHNHVIGIKESWTNKDIIDAELTVTGYVMFTKDRNSKNSTLTIRVVYHSPNIGQEEDLINMLTKFCQNPALHVMPINMKKNIHVFICPHGKKFT